MPLNAQNIFIKKFTHRYERRIEAIPVVPDGLLRIESQRMQMINLGAKSAAKGGVTMSKEHIKEISDIDCSVTSCVYHDGKTKCMAGKIQVGPRNACCSSETECATYEPDGGMQ